MARAQLSMNVKCKTFCQDSVCVECQDYDAYAEHIAFNFLMLSHTMLS